MRTWLFLVVGLAACAGATPAPSGFVHNGSGSGAAGGAGKPGGPADVSIDIGPTEIKGVFFEPEALGLPGMPMTQPKKKQTIDKHRAEIAKAKDPVVKQAEAAIVATLLYERSKSETGDTQKKTREDARQVLRDVLAAVGDKADETVLRMLGSYELLFEDYPSAEKQWAALVTAAPKDKEAPTNRAWWAYSLMKQGKNAEAVAALGPDKITEKMPDLSYVAAWAKWRTGDLPGAWSAMVTAAKGWGASPNLDIVQRDLILFAGRTNVAMAQALPDLSALLGKMPDQLYKIDSDLGLKSYQFSGRWVDGIGALEAALQAGGAKVPPEDKPTIRYFESVFTVPLDDPSKAAAFAKQALEALPGCGAKCQGKDEDNLMKSVYGMARLFHLAYATANDTRYQQPALDLYNAVVDKFKDPAQNKAASNDRDQLQRTIKVMKPTDGTHDKQALDALLSHHNQEVQACYEQYLSANNKLAGSLALMLESDQSGAIKGAATEPKAGQADIAGVATCVLDHARKWKLPTRARPGTTRLKLMFTLAPRK
jgi:tetratricopeptide (TPR) repeat protein